MKRFLTPRNILILVVVVVAFFVIKNQLVAFVFGHGKIESVAPAQYGHGMLFSL